MGVGDQVALVGFHGAHAVAQPVEGHLGRADHGLAECCQVRLNRVDHHGLHRRVRLYRVFAGQGAIAVAGRYTYRTAAILFDDDHLALLIETDHQLAHIPVLAGRGHHRHHIPVYVGCDLRIRPVDRPLVAGEQQVAGVGQQLVASAGDDHVDTVKLSNELYVVLDVLQVAGQDDPVHALRLQHVDLSLDDVHQVVRDHHVARRGDERQVGGVDSDHPNQLTPLFDDGGGDDDAGIHVGLQHRLAREVHVGTQVGRRVHVAGQEVSQHVGSEVEVVVAEADRVVADQLHGDGVVKGHPVHQAGVELRPGDKVVAGGDHQHTALGAPLCPGAVDGLPLQIGDHGLEAGRAAKVLQPGAGVDHLGLAIVVMQDGQVEVNLWLF